MVIHSSESVEALVSRRFGPHEGLRRLSSRPVTGMGGDGHDNPCSAHELWIDRSAADVDWADFELRTRGQATHFVFLECCAGTYGHHLLDLSRRPLGVARCVAVGAGDGMT